MEKAGEIPAGNGGLDDLLRQLDAITGGMDARAELVIVGEVIGEGQEAADRVQRGAADGERGAEAKVQATLQPARGEHGGGKVGGDAEGFELRAEGGAIRRACGAVGLAAIERGDHPHGRMLIGGRKRRQDVREIARANADIAVVDDENFVPRAGQELRQAAHLAVGTQVLRADDEADVALGKLLLKLAHQRHCGIVEAGNAEEDFVLARIILAAVAGERPGHAGIHAAQRLQDGDRRREANSDAAAAHVRARAQQGNRGVAQAGDGEKGGHRGNDQREHLKSSVDATPGAARCRFTRPAWADRAAAGPAMGRARCDRALGGARKPRRIPPSSQTAGCPSDSRGAGRARRY